jgi:hypothetical protein
MLLLDITNIADWKFGFADSGNEKKPIDKLCGALQTNNSPLLLSDPSTNTRLI